MFKRKKPVSKPKILSIHIIGYYCSGKTMVIHNFCGYPFEEHTMATIGPDFHIRDVKINEKEKVKVKIWDTPSGERFKQRLPVYIKNTQGIMIVYDVTGQESFEDVESWIKLIEDNKDINTFPIVLVGNKRDLEERRVITYEKGKELADKYNIPFFETSAKTNQGIDDAFMKLITTVYNNNYNNYHNKDLSPSELKDLISKLDSEHEMNEIKERIIKILNFLEEMEPVFGDFNYPKLFSLLFRKIDMLPNKIERNVLYANIYLQLLIVFPEKHQFIYTFNKENKVITLIHSFDNNDDKIKCYKLYTNNYTNFHLSCNDIIKIYNFHFFRLINNKTDFIQYFQEFSSILISLYTKFINKTNEGTNDTSPYVILLFESFGDVLFYITINVLLTGNHCFFEPILDTIKRIYPIFFEIHYSFKIIDKDMLYKIICLYCILTSYFNSNNVSDYYKIIEHILKMFKDNSEIFTTLLLEIFYSFGTIENSDNIVLERCLKHIYLSYYALSNKWNENTFLIKDYDECIKCIISSSDKINVYQGCLDLLSNCYLSKAISKDKFPSYNVIKVLYFFSLKKKGIKTEICNKIIILVSNVLNINNLYHSTEEWILIIELINNIIDKYNSSNHISNVAVNCISFILKVIDNHFDRIKTHHKIIEEMKKLLIKLSNKEKLNNNAFTFCFHYLRQDCIIDFIEPFIKSGFMLIQDNSIKDESKEISNFYPTLLNILQKKEEKEKNEIRKIIETNFTSFFDIICKKEIKNNNFCTLITNIITNTPNNDMSLIDKVFNFPIIENNSYSKTELEIIRKKTECSLTIMNNLLLWTKNEKNFQLIDYIIHLAYKKIIFYDFYTSISKGSMLLDVSLVTVIILSLKINQKSLILFPGSETPNAICYRQSSESVSNNSCYVIDIDSILSNYIYHMGLIAEYPNIEDYYKKFNERNKTFELGKNEKEILYCIIEICLNSIFCFSNENLQQILLIYLKIISDNKIVFHNDYMFCSILHFLSSCNYLLNYRAEQYYINQLNEQTNEQFFLFKKEFKLKDSILSSVINLTTSSLVNNTTKAINIYSLLAFYFNSSLDNQITNSTKMNNTVEKVIITLCDYLNQFEYIMIIISMLFMLKEILRHSDEQQIINYIYILLCLGRPDDLTKINSTFSQYITIKPLSFKLELSLLLRELLLYYHYCDIVSLYYICYLNKKGKSEIVQKFNNSLSNFFINQVQNDREIIFGMMIKDLLEKKERRSNINEKEVINNINKYKLYTGNKHKIFCYKENTVIEISPSSNLKYILSSQSKEEKVINQSDLKKEKITSLFQILDSNTNSKEDLNDYQNNLYSFENTPFLDNFFIGLQQKDNSAIITQKQKLVTSLLSIPILITYHVNIFYYPSEYNELLLSDLLNDIDNDDINPQFYSFISQLGDVYLNSQGDAELCYKDSFYDIKFELVNLKRNKEDRIEAIKQNFLNIIWIENQFTDITDKDNLFNPIDSINKHSIITITHTTNSHCLVRIKDSLSLMDAYNYNNNSSNNHLSIEEYLCQNYYMNINAFSSVRYLLHFIILISEELYYKNYKSIFYTDIHSENCLYERLYLIKQLNQI